MTNKGENGKNKGKLSQATLVRLSTNAVATLLTRERK